MLANPVLTHDVHYVVGKLRTWPTKTTTIIFVSSTGMWFLNVHLQFWLNMRAFLPQQAYPRHCNRGDSTCVRVYGLRTYTMGSSKVCFKSSKHKPDQLVKISCALRFKYRQGEKVRLPPFLVGFHPDNRGGAKMSGIRVLELLKTLLENGFDFEEADCGGVVIASASMVMEFNLTACAGDPLLVATVAGKALQFGSLSHSHLNQVLKNLNAQMAVPLEEQDDAILQPILGPSRDFQLPLLKVHDDTFEQYAREGL